MDPVHDVALALQPFRSAGRDILLRQPWSNRREGKVERGRWRNVRFALQQLALIVAMFAGLMVSRSSSDSVSIIE